MAIMGMNAFIFRRAFLMVVLCWCLMSSAVAFSNGNDINGDVDNGNHNNDDITPDWEDESHPDPNDEHYDGMIYVGRIDDNTGKRVGFDEDNGIRYIFGTSFDATHKEIEERDLQAHPLTPIHDLPEGDREQILKERRHGAVPQDGTPRRFGHVDTHELDGGVKPPKVVHVDPFFLDAKPVTNKQFAKFVKATYYETEAQKYGWSFGLISFIDPSTEVEEADPEAPNWVAVPGAYWRQPEGPKSSYKFREHHPVVHVSHLDAAEYCKWMGKRLPGEWEWEAAARAGHWGPKNRTLFSWGDDDSYNVSSKHANLWGAAPFPHENDALDGWRGTSPVATYPPNRLGFYDMTGNVWEWMRGGRHKERIVRGGSFVDSLDGSTNHAATLGARATMHATTTTGNVGFRCAKAPQRRTEYHYVLHDETHHGQLAVEDEFGKRDFIPQKGWEDVEFDEEDPVIAYDEDGNEIKGKKRRVVLERRKFSNEL